MEGFAKEEQSVDYLKKSKTIILVKGNIAVSIFRWIIGNVPIAEKLA